MDLAERHAGTTVRHPWERARAGFSTELIDADARPPRPAERPGVGDWHAGVALTRLVDGVIDVGNRIAAWADRRGRYYHGLSYWAVCTRA